MPSLMPREETQRRQKVLSRMAQEHGGEHLTKHGGCEGCGAGRATGQLPQVPGLPWNISLQPPATQEVSAMSEPIL